MSDHYEARVEANRIRKDCNPRYLADTTIAAMEGMVEGILQVNDSRVIKTTTMDYLMQAYDEACGQKDDHKCFESENAFVRALTKGIMARAEQYVQTMKAEEVLSPNDGRRRR